ncbi:histidine phosphatase family protein [bacterium 210917-DFI.7.65]|nr:histidine phosphatase family protein [bacterium 210917-DFI.7.65]
MKLYLLRHGRTLWNEEGRLQGRTDVPLSEEGRRSALAAGAALGNVSFDAAFSSPLQRARETAELILQGKNVLIQTDARLIELSFGAAEGMRLCDFQEEQRPTRTLFAAPECYVPPTGGESYEALVRRCRSFLDKRIVPEETRWTHVLVVAHGAAVRGLFSAMFGAESGRIYGGRVQKNCAVNVIDCTGGVFLAERVAKEFCEDV